MNPSKVIVLGGAGFIGTNVCLSALAKGAQVIIFDNLSRKGTGLNLRLIQERAPDQVTFIRGDIRSQTDVEGLFRQHPDADAVFHLAGQVAVTTSIKDPREDFEINLLGTLNLLEAMRLNQIPAPLLYASTNKVYGKMDGVEVVEGETRYEYRDYPQGISEAYPLDFHSPYGCSKGGADQYVLDYSRIYGIKAVVFRQSCIYGYYQFGIEDQGWVAWFTIASLFNLPITIYGDGKQVRDILFIDDLVNGYWSAIDHIATTNGNAYNIGGSSFRLSLRELLAFLEQTLGRKIPVTYGEPRQGDQKVFIADSSKAKREFGWSPQINAEQGVRRLVEWVKTHRHLFVEAGILKA
jgi:CDP-paratose 2-epimerase